MNHLYKKAVTEALEAVKEVQDADLKKSGFEIVLRSLLGVVPTGAPITNKAPAMLPRDKVANESGGSINKTGLTDDEVATLFEVNGETVVLKVKPVGESVPEQQQSLAHAILVGYKALFGKDGISASQMGSAAREWSLKDTNFATNIQTPGHIQAKGAGKGATYSLRPGAIGKLKDSMQKMARGE